MITDTARPGPWRDLVAGYGRISLLFHWTTAILVVAMIVLGLLMDWTIQFDDQSLYATIKWLHISTGVLLSAIILPRIAWRLYAGWVRGLPQPRLLQWLSVAVPMLLLLGVLVQVVTGLMARWTANAWPTDQAQTLPFFGLYDFPGPYTTEKPELNRFFEDVHEWTAYAVMTLLLIHILGALKHWLLDRGQSQWRMLKPYARALSPPSPSGRNLAAHSADPCTTDQTENECLSAPTAKD